MRKRNSLIRQVLALVLIFLLSACAEEPLGGNDKPEGGYTVTLRLSASMTPIPETKTTARSGNETEAAGFKYEMLSSDADRAATTPGIKIDPKPVREDSSDVSFVTKSLATKAPGVLKNTYALLFTSTGAFNGRAQIGTYTVNAAQDITVTNVVDPTASGCRLVIIANNNAATTSYASSAGTGNFAGFSGTYAEFQKLTIDNAVNQDIDVPYAGSATVNLSLGEIAATADISLSWTLAKITLNNHTFAISGGPARSSITLYNAGVRRFAPDTNNGYEGTGSTPTTAFVANTGSDNSNSVTWYVGENIQSPVTSIQTPADRNSGKAPVKACYIRVASITSALDNTNPMIGQEYITGRTGSFTYDYYLGKSSDVTDFALRRHTVYQFNTEISGTLAEQEEIAAEDGRVTLTKTGGESAGLCIGHFGGPSGYTAGPGDATSISGSYTKLLLLEPNTSRGIEMDQVEKVWGANSIFRYQPERQRHWNRTYIYDITTNGTIGGMSTATDGLYAYCHELTLGGVTKGTWYVPAQVQLQMIWVIYGGMKEGRFEGYTAFNPDCYKSSTELDPENSAYVHLHDGGMNYLNKAEPSRVRCVRDLMLSASDATGQRVITNHPSANGYPVIDVTELFPLGCVLTPEEAATRRSQINEKTPSNTEPLGVESGIYSESGIWNIKMSPQYQIMCTNHTIGATDWANAYQLCKQYKGEGGDTGEWRLPTQRELIVIWGLHPELREKVGFTEFNTIDYWSSSEVAAQIATGLAWYVNFINGVVGNGGKKANHYVRCVRDLV